MVFCGDKAAAADKFLRNGYNSNEIPTLTEVPHDFVDFVGEINEPTTEGK